MSSFICSSTHFNSVEEKLHLLVNDRDFYFPYELRDICPSWYNKRNYNTNRILEDITKIIDTLRELNVVCVSLQYRHHCEGNLDNEIQDQLSIVRVKNDYKKLSLHGLYNALHCINYQIEVDHLTNLRELTPEEKNALKFLDVMIKNIAFEIIAKMPDDNTCKWSID